MRQCAHRRAERVDERGLADPCLASDERELPAARLVDVGERGGERLELGGALEELEPGRGDGRGHGCSRQ